MTTEQHGSKTERIAELEREIARRMFAAQSPVMMAQTDNLRSELSCLRNEGGDSKTEEGRGDWSGKPCPHCNGTGKNLDGEEWERCMKCAGTGDEFITPSPLAPVEAGRGERETLERDLAQMDAKIERDVAAGDASPEAAQNVRAVIALARDGLAYRVLSQGNGGAAVDEDIVEKAYFTWAGTTSRYSESSPLHAFKAGVSFGLRHAAPSSQLEGVREALVPIMVRELEGRRFVEQGSGRYLLTQSQAFDAFVATLEALTTTPSRGLVDAAEWPALDHALSIANADYERKRQVPIEAAKFRKMFEKKLHLYDQLAQQTIRALLADIDDRREYTQVLIDAYAKRMSAALSAKPTATADEKGGAR